MSDIKVSVLFFSVFRELAGRKQIELDLPDKSDVDFMFEKLISLIPEIAMAKNNALVSVNNEFVGLEQKLEDGDTVAIFPPVSGGSSDFISIVGLESEDIDFEKYLKKLVNPEVGAICTFNGVVREITTNQKGDIESTDALFYEAYEEMAIPKMEQIINEVRSKFNNISGMVIIQRTGFQKAGKISVQISCASSHRNDGVFEAVKYGIDRLKQIVPVWKKNIGQNGENWIEGDYFPEPNE